MQSITVPIHFTATSPDINAAKTKHTYQDKHSCDHKSLQWQHTSNSCTYTGILLMRLFETCSSMYNSQKERDMKTKFALIDFTRQGAEDSRSS